MKKKEPTRRGIALNDDDLRILKILEKRWGQQGTTGLIRLAIREAAKA
jgi:hypothetical protein